jgi:hypothetical protein
VHTAVVAPNVIDGNGFTVTVKLFADDTHPFALLTVKVPVYVPAAVFAGIGILIGFAGNAAFVTGKKLFAGLAFHVIL